VKTHIALIHQWKLFCLEKPEPHVQLSFSTDAGLLVKNLYLKHPHRKYTIKFLSDIKATGSFRTVDDLEQVIQTANFRPDSIEWRYDAHGDKQIVRFIRHYY
jgi:hypothetical protein